jgi:hypothetical protein
MAAQANLGRMYYYGLSVPQNFSEASRWFREAADQGDARAQYGLGTMYFFGQGMPRDYVEAVHWYRKAAEQGDAKGEYNLGLMYYHGQGVPKDYAEAGRWYRQAADQGLAKAQYDFGYLCYYGQGVQQDREEADRWFHKAADQGDENAQRTLGFKQVKWTKTQIFILLFKLILGISLSIGFMLPGMSLRGIRQRIIAGTGVLCLLSAGLSLLSFTHFEMQQTKSDLIALSLITWLLDGTVLVLLIYIFGSGKKAAGTPLAAPPRPAS